MKTVMFNPYTGTPRHPSDIASDPEGLLILEPGAPLRAAVKKANSQAEHFEREWYLRGDVIEDAAAEIRHLSEALHRVRHTQALATAHEIARLALHGL